MAITYPRDLPSYDLAECSFNLDDNVSMSPSARGLVLNRTQTLDPVWRAVITSGLLQTDMRAIWSAWKKSLGGLRPFVAYDLQHPMPRAYPTATAPGHISAGWNGTADVTALGAGGALSLAGLPSTYKAKAGDRIGIEQAGRYGYYEILEDKTALAGAVTLTLAPFLHTTVFTTAATARLWRPKCQFVLDWNSWQETTVPEPTPITFQAVQLL